MKIHPGARQAALVGSFEGLADDVYALYYNPAGILGIRDGEFAANHTQYFQSINFDYLAAAMPLKAGGAKQAMGLSITSLSVEKIEKRSGDTDTPESTFSAGDAAYQVSYAREALPRLDVGISAKYISSRIESFSAEAFAADVGVLWKPEYQHIAGVGLTVRNAGGEMKFKEVSDPLPLSVTGGLALQWFDKKLTLLPGFYAPRDNDPALSLGAEWKQPITPGLDTALRAGYTTWERGTGGTRSLGIGFGLNFRQFGFDFGWIPYGDLGNTFRYSILARF
ncbi:MAG: PorV/PorQ family protein [Elusimicrobia bacterium]|nr:PorV/PorQ family protein [Elusimicrobiota bacterium]